MNPTVAIIAPGEMGSAVGRRLTAHGLKVLTSLIGRSERSAARARDAGMAAVADDQIAAADFVLSIVPPGEAHALAERLVLPLQRVNRKPVYVDCNAVSPDTTDRIAAVIAETTSPFVDVGIIGAPPGTAAREPVFYASGAAASRFATLSAYGLDIRVLDSGVGAASALKMSYAGITKGLTAIGAVMMLAATRADAAGALHHELSESQPALLTWLTRQLPRSYPKAYRWVAEMEEIAAFVGDDPAAREIFEGAAKLYQRLAADFESSQQETGALTEFLNPSR